LGYDGVSEGEEEQESPPVRVPGGIEKPTGPSKKSSIDVVAGSGTMTKAQQKKREEQERLRLLVSLLSIFPINNVALRHAMLSVASSNPGPSRLVVIRGSCTTTQRPTPPL
jgi:hypothetical protein